MRRYSWWVRAVSGGNAFLAKYRGPFGGSLMSGGRIIILCVIRRHFLSCGRGPSCRLLHVQSTSDACRSWTTLTTPRREHQGGERRRGLGRERHGGREDSVVCLPRGGEYDCTRVYWFVCRRQRVIAGVGLWVSRGMARPAMGVRWGGESCAAAEPAAGRREQAVPPALV